MISKIRKIKSVIKHPHIFIPKNYIFMLSHMRSRSSVLAHILGSNKEICGYDELHISYKKKIDLIKMQINLAEREEKFRSTYYMDKLLLNRHIISDHIITMQPKIIILLRKPVPTIKSLISMYQLSGETGDPERALKYYCSRLLELKKFVINLDDYFFIHSEDLIKKTDTILKELSQWLLLKKELTKDYSVFNNTGRIGHGDPSENIKRGKIIKTAEHKINIPFEISSVAEGCYNEFLEVIQ